MKIVMLSVYDDGKKALNPGDVVEMEDIEAQRVISVGGARLQTPDELEAAAAQAAKDAEAKARQAEADAAAKAAKK